MTFARRLRSAIAAVLLLAGLCSCSVESGSDSSSDGSSGSGEIDADDLETKAKDALMEERPEAPEPDISCPDSLPTDVGATTRCVLRVDGSEPGFGVTVEVTDSTGDSGDLDIQVDEQPLGPDGLDG